jgi:hypothetical protein
MNTSGKIAACLLLVLVGELNAQEWYKLPEGTETRWASFENPSAAKGKGGAENKKAKGHPSEMFAPGETKTLLNTTGAGVIQRIWMTISDRTPQVLRAIRIEMYWDGSFNTCSLRSVRRFFWCRSGKESSF